MRRNSTAAGGSPVRSGAGERLPAERYTIRSARPAPVGERTAAASQRILDFGFWILDFAYELLNLKSKIQIGERDFRRAAFHQQRERLQVQARLIQPPPGAQDIVVLTAGRADERRRLQPGGAQRLPTGRAGVAVGVEGFVHPA